MRVKGLPAEGWRQAAVWFEDGTPDTALTPTMRDLPDGTQSAPRIDQEAVLRTAIRDACSAYGYTRPGTFEEFTAGTRCGFAAAVEKVPEEEPVAAVTLPETLECARCGAAPGAQCRTASGARTKTHVLREYAAQRAQREAEETLR
jgi:hypothetical protein